MQMARARYSAPPPRCAPGGVLIITA